MKILLVFFLSFLLGLEREERKSQASEYAFGGVRALPLIGLTGYGTSVLSGSGYLPFSFGLLAVGGLMLLSYWHKLSRSPDAGLTSELSGLIAYVLGALVYREQYWIASTLVIFSLLLLEMKAGLERLSKQIAAEEILTFTKFLLLTVVILPIFPNQAFGSFQINPFKTWLVVVATSGISYVSYIIQKLLKGRGGILLAAVLGGAYSSTVTTVVLAKRGRADGHSHLFNGGILAASGMMYLRLSVLLGIFNLELFHRLGSYFLILALFGLAGGALWTKLPDLDTSAVKREYEARNPLELHTAFLFALFFLVMLVVSQFAVSHLGKGGVYGLAALMGLTDVDPFILSMTQSKGVALELASISILIAASSNNALKGLYTYTFSDRKSGLQGLGLLLGFAVLGLLPLFFMRQ